MSDEILAYYNSELTYLRELGGEFAEKYPKVAGRLHLEADKCDDPHVERLLEGFAFLSARIRHKLDDEFPLRLTTGRRLTDYNTGVQSGGFNSPIRFGACIDLSPEDMAGLDVNEGEWVRISSRRGALSAAATL